jgi:hypothetical protein
MRYLPIALMCAALPALAHAADDGSRPIPFHELVGMYENCLASATPKFPVEQAFIAKSLCFCQTEAFSRSKTYAELAALAKSPGAFNGAADGYMETCVARVQDEIQPAK